MSGRFSPLTRSAPASRDLPLCAPLVFSDFAHLTFWPATLHFSLRSRSALMRSHVCVNMSRLRYPHKCCFTWYYYIDSCNIRYAPNRRITPGTPKWPAPTPSTAKAVRGAQAPPVSGPTLPKAFPQIQNCHYTPAATK